MNPYKNLKFLKRIQVEIVLEILWLAGVVERLGFLTVSSVKQGGRVFLYLILITTMLKGFGIGHKNSLFYNLPNLFVAETGGTQVLGAAKKIVYPVFLNKSPLPVLTAKSVYAVDLNSKMTLVDNNKDLVLAPASTTKLMTALVVLDLYDLDELVLIPEMCTQIESQKSGFLANDTLSVKSLLYSLLVNSGGDAACALSLGKVSYADFIDKMNKKAKLLGMQNTQFTNPIGLDAVNGEHHSTAHDLFRLASVAIENELIQEIVATKEVVVKGSSGFEVNLFNTNELLWTLSGTVGIKTGKTVEAGEVLVYEYQNDDVDLIIVLMGSESRFYETQLVLNWILDNYTWQS